MLTGVRPSRANPLQLLLRPVTPSSSHNALLQLGCDIRAIYEGVSLLPFRGCLLLYQGLSDPQTGRPALAFPAPGALGGTLLCVPWPGRTVADWVHSPAWPWHTWVL